MCGISAIVAFDDRSRRTAARDVAFMHDRVPHRGPDGEGFALVGCDLAPREFSPDVPARVALAFRWLIVQDPSPAAAQPMSSANGLALLVHNGEIYNHPELREELVRLGHTFRSRSDSEVILAAYEQWGTECFRRFNGMWAVVLADAARRRVIVSRDRFGIRPLFYAEMPGRIVFASEIKQILPLLPSVRVNEHYVHDYLNEGTIIHFDQETFFEGVRTVPPATVATIGIDAPQQPVKFEKYWDPGDYQKRPGTRGTFEDAAGEFTSLLKSAVEVTLRTDAPLGSFLSGGLDSSVATAMIRELQPSVERDTYSIVFDRNRYAAFDESPYIDDFVSMHHCRNLRATIDAQWIATALPDVTWTHEEPLVASAQMAQYRAFQLARECNARVVIDGQGSDELLAGYPLHEWQMWRERLAKGHVVTASREMRILRKKLGATFREAVIGQLALPMLSSVLRRAGVRRRRYDFVRPESAAVRQAREREAAIGKDSGPAKSSTGRTIYRDLKSFRLRPILNNGDRAGMAHSMESRLPYLDHRLVEFVLSLPAEFSVGFGERKRLLRAAARTRLPISMLERHDKMGFTTPEPLWLRRELAPDVRSAVDRLSAVPYVDSRRASGFVDRFLAGRHNDWRAVWRLYAFPAWLQRFGFL